MARHAQTKKQPKTPPSDGNPQAVKRTIVDGSSLAKALGVPAVTLIVLAVGLFELERKMPVPSTGVALNGQLSVVSKATLDTLVDLTKQFMGWSLAVVGAVGYFLKASVENKVELRRIEVIFAELCIVASVLSVYFGHLVLNAIILTLSIDLFNLQDPAIRTPVVLQYVTFLLSLVLGGAYFHLTVWTRTPRNRQSS